MDHIQDSNWDSVPCAVCGARSATISATHLRKHDMSMAEYRALYPSSPRTSGSTSAKMAARMVTLMSNWKGKPVDPDIVAARTAKGRLTRDKNKKPAWNKGKPHSEETKAKISEDIKRRLLETGGSVLKGKPRPEEWKAQHKALCKQMAIDRPELAQKRAERNIELNKRLRDTDPSYMERKRLEGALLLQKTMEKYGVEHYNELKIDPEIRAKLKDYDLMFRLHVTEQRPITSVCQELGLHWKSGAKSVLRSLRNLGITRLYHTNISQGQTDVADFVKGLGVQVVSNDRTIIRPLELDIVIPSHKLAIEYCGLHWHNERVIKDNAHRRKMVAANAAGYQLITLFEDEWLNSQKIVKRMISHRLGVGTSTKINARSCHITEMSDLDKRQFLNLNHIQGDGDASITYALRHDTEVVAVMCFKRHNDEATWILNRYCTSCNVRGGFTKLLTEFRKHHSGDSIVTFADLRWGNGDLYRNNGFVLESCLPPDYAYVSGGVRMHKFNFRHSNMCNMLESYDPELSEHQNCLANGWYRIYNCGLLRFVLPGSCSAKQTPPEDS